MFGSNEAWVAKLSSKEETMKTTVQITYLVALESKVKTMTQQENLHEGTTSYNSNYARACPDLCKLFA